jgi:hypothetical protein
MFFLPLYPDDDIYRTRHFNFRLLRCQESLGNRMIDPATISSSLQFPIVTQHQFPESRLREAAFPYGAIFVMSREYSPSEFPAHDIARVPSFRISWEC